MLVDVRPKKLTGKAAETGLDQAAITCNKNGIPFDPEKPAVTSGIRLGSPAATTRGFGKEEFRLVGELIGEALDGLAASPEQGRGRDPRAAAGGGTLRPVSDLPVVRHSGGGSAPAGRANRVGE